MATKAKKKTLRALIEALPTDDVQTKDLKTLALQFVLDTPLRGQDSRLMERYSRQRLDALKLLLEITKAEETESYQDALVALLANNDYEED